MEKEHDVYLPVYLSLVTLTLLSFGSFYMGPGKIMAVAVALALATAKALLIALYFMHLKDEHPVIYGMVFVGVAAVILLAFGILPDVAVKL